ncbi:ankyrin repeat domain-containing protein [Candidatus Babeliales bacterium]|nr:ankyrin repeat domain-containing protein [Candidatus Babeliales bacterium]
MNRTFIMSLAAMTLFSFSLAAHESRKTIRSFDASWKLIFEEALKKHASSWKLVKAIRAHDNKQLSQLLKNPTINVNPIVMKGSEGFETQLHPLNEAISCNNIEAVKLLLAHTVTLGTTKKDADGNLMSHYFDVKDIDVNAPGYNGLTPLHTAVGYEAVDCIKLLLAHKDIKLIDQDLIDLVQQELDLRNKEAKRALEIWMLLSEHGQILDGPGGMGPNYDWQGILIGPDTLPHCPCCTTTIA